MNYHMKALCIAVLLICCPQQQGRAEGNWIKYLVVGIAGIFVGVTADACYQASSYKQAQETCKERLIITESVNTLDRIKAEMHPLMNGTPRYTTLVNIINQHGMMELDAFELDLEQKLELVKKQKNKLQKITGLHGLESAELAQKAQELFSKYTVFEQRFSSWYNLTHQVRAKRSDPLKKCATLRSFVERFEWFDRQSQADDQLLTFVRNEYNGMSTEDGVKGSPLICAVEDINRVIKQLDCISSDLRQHRSLVNADAEVDAKLQEIEQWQALLKKVIHSTTSSYAFQKEASEYSIRREALLNLQIEHREAEKLQHQAVAERTRAEADRLREKNREKELAIQQATAQANAIQAVTNMVGATAAVIDSLTHQNCPCHHHDFYYCPIDCYHRQDYVKIYIRHG